MSGPIRVKVVVEGWRELRRKLASADAVLGRPWAEALTRAAEIVEAEARRRSPHRTGALRAAVKSKVQARPVPMWARVSANKTRRGFRYGFALNYSVKRPYRFAGTRRPTFRWFTGALSDTRSRVNSLLERAASAIEQAW